MRFLRRFGASKLSAEAALTWAMIVALAGTVLAEPVTTESPSPSGLETVIVPSSGRGIEATGEADDVLLVIEQDGRSQRPLAKRRRQIN
jgi:Tol biopolymer transport system component